MGLRPVLLGAFVAVVVTGGCGDGADAVVPPDSTAPRYVDVTRAAGVELVTWCGSPSKDHLLESTGSGAAFVDLDGDGADDLLVLNAWRLADREEGEGRRVLSRGRFAFYRNDGAGRFEDRTAAAGLEGGGSWGCGVAAGDMDGDGDLDLYVFCFGANLLFRNLGDGTFEDIGAAAGVADTGWAGGAAFFDADGDGDLDLYLANYVETTEDELLRAERSLIYKGRADVMVGPFGLEGGRDRFYRNLGDGRFEDATRAAGLWDEARGFGLGVLAADFDDDGDLDLYVANDSNPNFLYRNDGSGHFEEIGALSGSGFSADADAQAGMGVEVADLDGDGILDIFVTNFAQDSCTLYRGEGALFFGDVSARCGIAKLTFKPLSWGTLALDFDQDGLLDLLVANGHIYPQVDGVEGAGSYSQKILLLHNRGEVFAEGSSQGGPGLQVAGSFRALATGDLEGDGDPDLLLTRIDEPPLLLRYEGGDPDRYLVVAPTPGPGPSWIGARIDVTTAGRTQSRVVLSGGSYASQSNLKPVFGLGAARRAERVVVRLPGGARLEYRDVPGGSTLEVPLPER